MPHKQAGDMTAPDPQSSIIIQDHIAKRAPSRHDITVDIAQNRAAALDSLENNIGPKLPLYRNSSNVRITALPCSFKPS